MTPVAEKRRSREAHTAGRSSPWEGGVAVDEFGASDHGTGRGSRAARSAARLREADRTGDAKQAHAEPRGRSRFKSRRFRPPQEPSPASQPIRGMAVWRAAEELRQLALDPETGTPVKVAEDLRAAANENAEAWPRHAALALAARDALVCSSKPLDSNSRRKVFFEVALALGSRFVGTDTEMKLLNSMAEAGLERTPPFDDSIVFQLMEERSGDEVR